MAQLAKKPCEGDWSFEGGDFKVTMARHNSQLRALEEASAKVDPTVSLVGALVSFPAADGSAIYRVSKDKPLMLQHVPAHDGYHIPYTQIRGLRRADIVSMIRSDARMRTIFS